MRMKTLESIVSKHGEKAFLAAAAKYTCHIRPTAWKTIYEMETRWYGPMGGQTEAEKMLEDYNAGQCSLSSSSLAVVDMGQAMEF